MTKLIIGLGNPEEKYKNTRHNIGYMFLDSITRKFINQKSTSSLDEFKDEFNFDNKFDAGVCSVITANTIEKFNSSSVLVLIKPKLGMNDSGIPVSAFMNYHKLSPNDVIVIHDDLDLIAGKVKIKQGGGHAGHNGLKSIDACIGPEYHRIRIGIGRPEKGHSVLEYVLGDFKEEDKEWMDKVFLNCEEYINKCM